MFELSVPAATTTCQWLCDLDLVDVSDIFYFFLFRGGEGEVRSDREGGGFGFY